MSDVTTVDWEPGRGVVGSSFVTIARLLLIACVLLGGFPGAHAQGGAGPRIYGIEIDKDGDADRLLVFADGPVEVQQVPVNAGSAVLVFPNGQLDPSAPNRLRGPAGSRIRLMNLFERKNADPPEVRLVVQVRPGPPPLLSERGSVVALVFPPAPGAAATPREPARSPSRRAPPRGRRPSAPSEPTFPVRMLGVTLEEAVKRLASFIEQPILLTGGAIRRGTINVDAPEPVTRREARALLEAVLLLKGMALVSTPGGVFKVVPITGDIGPWVETLSGADGPMLVTTLVKLEAIEADLVLQAINPLVGSVGFAIPLARSNGIILAGARPRVERLVSVIRELDRTGPRKMALLRLEHADAVTTASQIESALMKDDVTGLQIWPDERTNRIIVRGRSDKVEEVRTFVDAIDREPDGRGRIQVIPVLYADVDRMAEMLRSLQSGATELRGAGRGSLAGRDFGVSVHAPTHSLVVRGDPQTISVIRSVLEEIDEPPARIDVEVTVEQVTLDQDYAFGLSFLTPLLDADDPDDLIAFVVADPGGAILPGLADLADPLNQLDPNFDPSPVDLIPDGNLQTVLTYDPLNIPIEIPGLTEPLSLAAVAGLDATDNGVDTRLLIRPRLSLLSGEEHEIFAGDDIPIPVSNTAEGGDPARDPSEHRAPAGGGDAAPAADAHRRRTRRSGTRPRGEQPRRHGQRDGGRGGGRRGHDPESRRADPGPTELGEGRGDRVRDGPHHVERADRDALPSVDSDPWLVLQARGRADAERDPAGDGAGGGCTGRRRRPLTQWMREALEPLPPEPRETAASSGSAEAASPQP